MTTIDPNVRGYLESLLKETNLWVSDPREREEMLQELFARLDNYLHTVILNNLSDHARDGYVWMLESGKSKQDIEAYLKAHLKGDPQQLFKQAFIDFRDMYISRVHYARQQS